MPLTEIQRVSYKMFGGYVTQKMRLSRLQGQMNQARMPMRAEAFVSYALVVAGVIGFFFFIFTLIVLLVVLPLLKIALPAPMLAVGLMAPVLFASIAYFAIVSEPSSKAKSRGKEIDRKLPYALSYISAMASAGVNIDHIFASLAQQKVYGAVADEAAAIYADIVLYGKDAVTAMKRAIGRSPSDRWSDVLQGGITTFGSGGDLQTYFAAKAERYSWENRQEQRAFVETMGLMAETYVTAAVAGPLFLIIMMAIMGMLSGQGPEQLGLVVYLMLPVVNGAFVYGLSAMTPEV